MTTLLITEARSKYNKSYISLGLSNNRQYLLLGTRKSLKLSCGEMVRINVALPHKVLSWTTPIVFTNDFLLEEVERTPLDRYTNLHIYTFTRHLAVREGVYTLPNTKISGRVVFE
jgi:hypothetical protein